MIVRKGSQWQLYPHKVKYTQRGEELERYALPNKQWWKDFAEQWGHTEIIEFTEIELSDEQLTRYEEVKDMPEDFSNLYENYILTGDTSSDFELPTNHPFNIIRLRKENERLRLDTMLTNMEVFGALSAVATSSEINQAQMMMELMNMLGQLQGGE